MSVTKVDAIMLAGAPAGAEFAGERVASRAMVRVGKRTMLQRVLDALRDSQSVGRIVAVGEVAAEGLDQILKPGPDLVTNIRLGIEALNVNGPVLAVSSDIPLLTGEAVSDFVGRALPLDADLAYPIIPKAFCEARYPQLKRTYVRTADGVFTGGNLMLIRPAFVTEHWQTVADAYAARKRIFKLARMIGYGVLVRVIAAQVVPSLLHVAALERAASRMLGARVAAVVSAHPEIGEDVDKPSDLAAVRRILGDES